ncbi:uncharacterized protein LOC116181643 [Photinus pyralis]|uniref:uncharacterized protein LOC116181643 n=1 Tax=Photinus pyralis TaxID=7054 RepID=UPI001266E6AE|nr:uncharacterized protein LOC116181643 [Photinus pyralis]
MEEFFSKIGLSHLLPEFTKQSIDSTDLLPDLTEEHIVQLIPNIGDRIKFNRGVRSIQIEQATIDFIDECTPPPSKKPYTESTPVSFLVENATNLLDTYVDLDAGPSTNTLHDINSMSTVTNTDQSDCGLNSSFLNYCSIETAVQFNLQEVLNADVLGRAILSKYNSKFTLDGKERNVLCEIIISHFLNKSFKLNNESLSIIANKIVALFPACEKRATYFVSPIPKKRSGRNKPEVAKGKLVDKHRNKLTALRRALQFDVSVGENISDENEEPNQNARDSRLWLLNNNEPVEEVLQHWRNSYSIRKITVNKNKTIEQFYKEWPILETQLAIELVTYDFNKLFEKEGATDDTFNFFFEKLLDIRRKNLSAADESILQLVEGDITTDSKRAVQLYLLPSLVPPRGRIKAKGKQWKPSITECRDGLFVHVKLPGDIDKAKRDKVDFMYNRGQTVQPYVILVGPSLNNVTGFYVVINDNLYKCISVFDALDFCFKSHHIFDAKYSFESHHIWYLIQWQVYNLKTKSDLKIPFVQDCVYNH